MKGAKFYRCDFLKFKSKEKFDAIIAYDSLFHFEYHTQKFIYQKISYFLKKGGYLLFTHGKADGEISGVMFD